MKIEISVLILILIKNVTSSISNDTYDCLNPNNKLGLCVSLYACPTMLRLFLKSRGRPEDGTFLQKSFCANGFGPWPFVCCSNEDSYSNDIPHSNGLPLMHLSNQQECTTDSYLSIAVFSVNTGHCLGSLINERYILTSAWCAAKSTSQVLYIGKSNATGFNIEKKISHESYAHISGQNYTHDIGLIRLSERISFSTEIAPSCLPSAVNGFKSYKIGENVIIPERLGSNVNLIHIGKIAEICCNSDPVPKEICVSNIEKHASSFEYGAPFVTQYNGAWVVNGVFGFHRTNECNIFARILDYEKWIACKIEP